MTKIRFLVALILVSVPFRSACAQEVIGENEVEKWIAAENGCGDDLDRIQIIKLEEVDLTHDGRQQAIVVAMSCNTGTAGPDVQSVLVRNPDGKLAELKVPTVDSKVLEANLFGPGNADLDVAGDLLALSYTDSTGREKPLVVSYKWNGQQFEIVAIEKSKPFPTSYDCSKADEDVDRAICVVKTVADLDVQLGALYKKRLSDLPARGKAALRDQQRKWLAARNSACPVNDKWFVDCLENQYRQRLTELQTGASRP